VPPDPTTSDSTTPDSTTPDDTAPAIWAEQANGIQLNVLRWGPKPAPGDRDPKPATGGRDPEPNQGDQELKPATILVCGTGFPGLTWHAVAQMLADDYTVYSFDRRGHGNSEKPPPVGPDSAQPPGWGYDFSDFADDLLGLIDALKLTDRHSELYGIGHSAGGTDLLLAAGRRPGLFARVLVHEPTIAHSKVEAPGPPPPALRDGASGRRRRIEFESAAALFTRYGSRPPFNVWRAGILWDYVEGGFETRPDGSVRLLCLPDVEAEMLVAIGSAISQNHVAEGLDDPFPIIENITCPVMLTTGALSQPQYRRMAAGAVQAIPHAQLQEIPGCTHFLPMQLPEELIARVRAFANA